MITRERPGGAALGSVNYPSLYPLTPDPTLWRTVFHRGIQLPHCGDTGQRIPREATGQLRSEDHGWRRWDAQWK